MTRGPVYVQVPVGTFSRSCERCPATIYFVSSPRRNGKLMPIDCAADENCRPPSSRKPGVGVSHYGTCPEADHFRRSRA